VIFNDRRHKQLQEEREQEEQEEQRSPVERVSSLLHLTGRRSTNKELSSSNSRPTRARHPARRRRRCVRADG
ncbi:hypothetical protein M9458_020753, partial [Cirrhinus mrigala]